MLRGRTRVQEERRSDTLDEEILATAVPVLRAGRPEGAVRITQSVEAVRRATRTSILGLVAVGGLVLLLGLGAGALIARQIARPLRRLDAAAARLGHGDLSTRVPVEGSAEQQGLARTFNEMGARLERLVAGQREFVADASHQLRTPLSGLRLRLEEARATGDPEEVEAALKEVDRLSAMVSELLLLSQAGEVDAPAEDVELDAAARRAAQRFDGRVNRVSITGGADGPLRPRGPRPRARRADRERAALRRRGGGRPRHRPALDRRGGRRPGLDEDELEAVFDRFHRGRAGRAARRAPASASRSPATSCGAGAPRSRWRTATRAAPWPRSPSTALNRALRTVTPRMRTLAWILGALAGVVLAAGVTYAASSLSTQSIGLSSEPVSAGDDLAPQAPPTPTPTPTATPTPRKKKKRPTPTPTPTPTPRPAVTPVPTADDHGGGDDDDDSSGRGRGRGRGGDDDD